MRTAKQRNRKERYPFMANARTRSEVESEELKVEPRPEPTHPRKGRSNNSSVDPALNNGLNLSSLKAKKIAELANIGKSFSIESAANMRRQDLIFAILQAQTEKNGYVYGEGVLETFRDTGDIRSLVTAIALSDSFRFINTAEQE